MSGKENVLITGGAGFIGSNFIRKILKNDIKVKTLDDLSSGKLKNIKEFMKNPNFEFFKTDLLRDDIDDYFKGVDMVFHFAADPDVRLDLNDTNKSFNQNIVVTRNVLASMRKNNVKQIYFTSSSAVYGEAKTIPTKEDYGFLEPISLYGASKLACEALISSYCHNFEMRSLIFRLANIIGSGCHGVVPDFINKLRNDYRRLEILGNGLQKKSYMYIDDLLDAILFLIEKNKSNFDIFNIGSDDFINVKEIASLVSDEMKTNPKFIFTGGRGGWIGDVPVMKLDISKLKNLGWSPKYNSKNTIIKTTRDLI